MTIQRSKLSPLLIVLLVFVFGVSAASLSQAFAQTRPTVVNYWLWLDDATDPVWAELVDEFNATHPDIEVRYELIPLAQYYDRMLTALAAGSPPDAARFKEWWLGEFVEEELLVPLDPFIDEWAQAGDVVENLWNTGKVTADSPVFMLPHQYITFYLYYNRAHLQNAEIDVPQTYEEFVDAARQVTDRAQNRYGFGLRGGAGGQDQWLAFMMAGGCQLVDDRGQVVADSQVCVEANQRYLDLFREHQVTPPSAPADGFAQILGAFEAGITTFAAHHVGSANRLIESMGDNLGVMDIPPIDPDRPATMAAMSGNVIFSDSANQEAAWTFISWLTEPEPMDKMSRSRNGQLPVLRSVAAQDFYQQNPYFKLSLEQADYARTWPPLTGVSYVASEVWQSSMQRALLGEITSQQMMEGIASALRNN
jgi:multiple sugar transport system substrate-binding protein